jgi:hypothetical protein
MTNAVAKAVLGQFADLYSRAKYLTDYATNLREPLGKGDTVEVPNIGSLTVGAASSSGTAADVSPQSVTPSIISLSCNLEPAIFCEIPALLGSQYLDGNFASQLASQGLDQLRAYIDGQFAEYLAKEVAWTTGTAATYHVNVAAAALTRAHILAAKAYLESNDGSHNLVFAVSSYGLASIMNLAEFIPNFSASEQGVLGIPMVGSVFGMPVVMSNAIPSAPTAAASASAIASNVLTLTVPAGHGFVAGQKITTSGCSANVTTAAAITSTTSTSIVVPLTSGDNATNGAGTVTGISALNLMMDVPHVYIAQQKMPSLRTVPYYNRTSDALQISAIWGRLARAGRVVVVNSLAASLS